MKGCCTGSFNSHKVVRSLPIVISTWWFKFWTLSGIARQGTDARDDAPIFRRTSNLDSPMETFAVFISFICTRHELRGVSCEEGALFVGDPTTLAEFAPTSSTTKIELTACILLPPLSRKLSNSFSEYSELRSLALLAYRSKIKSIQNHLQEHAGYNAQQVSTHDPSSQLEELSIIKGVHVHTYFQPNPSQPPTVLRFS